MKFHGIRQHFPRPRITDIERTVRDQLAGARLSVSRGASIAIAVGSRGIANIAAITGAVVAHVHEHGAQPFIVPAMGSHGGATAEGQTAVLASYGVTQEAMGCPIRSSMDLEQIQGTSLYMDQHAWNSDGVVVINRIKPHTDFRGAIESGVAKMIVIGLGKEKQAHAFHSFGVHGLRDMVPKAAKEIIATGKILIGIGIVENAYDETAIIEAIPPNKILTREPELLDVAKQNMPRLPVDDLDVLIVDRLGKNISGTGMDTNVIGRIRIAGEPELTSPRIKSIVVTDLSEESHGNATGIGLADVVTRQLFDKIDFKTTYRNIITSGFLERGKLPVVAETEDEALAIGLRGAGCREPTSARVIRIKDTLHLSEILVSDAVLTDIHGRENIEILHEE